MTPEERAHELGLLRESDGLLNQREVFLLEEIDRASAEVAEVKAQCAAILEKVAGIHWPELTKHGTIYCRCGAALSTLGDQGPGWEAAFFGHLIPTDYAAALEEVKRQARLAAFEDVKLHWNTCISRNIGFVGWVEEQLAAEGAKP